MAGSALRYNANFFLTIAFMNLATNCFQEEMQEESGGIPGKWRLEFRSPVECQVMRSGFRWNSRLVEHRILEFGGMPGLEF